MTIDFSTSANQLFTRVFFEVQNAVTRYVVVYGGASSSKSYSVHQLEIINLLDGASGDTLVIRKHASDLRESCFKLFKQIIAGWDLNDHFKFVYSNDQRYIEHRESGRKLIFKGIDDPENLKSIVGVKRIVIEEASQLEFDDMLELNRRARGMQDIQIVLILNPISENHWIKTKMADVAGPYYADTTVLKFTYRDNCNLDGESFLTDADVKALEALKIINENHYRIYVEGDWGVDNKEGKFCWAFDRSQIKPTTYEPQRLLWATFDFNINPMTCTVAQVLEEETTLRAIECIKLENSNIWEMCDRLTASYPDAIWHITGDASGNNGSAMIADNLNYYLIIRDKLHITNQQIFVPLSNPLIKENRILVNAVHKNWTVEIDPERCKPLIYDLQYVEVDEYGKILKGEKRNGSDTHNNKKKFADFLDNWRYLINIAVADFFNWR